MDAVFGYDSRTFRTLWLLFAEPGEFTRRYLVGQRASLLPPFRLFVIATIVFFLVLQLTGIAIVAFRVQMLPIKDMTPAQIQAFERGAVGRVKVTSGEYIETISIDLFARPDAAHRATLTPEQKKNLEETQRSIVIEEGKGATPEEAEQVSWLRKSTARVMQGYERALADPVKLNAPLNVWLPRLMLVLVPVFALLLAAMHWWPRVYLAEHLVFSVHLHTVVFVAMSLTALTVAIVGDSEFLWAVWTILLVYFWMALYRVYGRSWWLTTIKFFSVLVIYSIVLSVGLGAILVLALSEV